MVLEKTLESPLDCKKMQPVHLKGDQSWMFIGGTDVEAETPVLWPPDAESWLIWKDPDALIDWGQEVKGTTEHEMVGWHHWHNGHGFGWTLGVDDGQGCQVCLPRHEVAKSQTQLSDWTDWLNWMYIFVKGTYFWIILLSRSCVQGQLYNFQSLMQKANVSFVYGLSLPHCFSSGWKWKLLSRVPLCDPWTIHFLESSRPECWIG